VTTIVPDDDTQVTTPVANRLSVNLSNEAAMALRSYVQRHGITVTEAIRRAISLLKYIDELRNEGQKILVSDKAGKNIREVVFFQ
jgi:hypothetical protein